MLQEYTTVSMKTTDPTFPAWRSSVVEASLVYALARSIRDPVRFSWTLGMGCARTRLILRFFHRQETGTFRTRLRDGTWRAGAQAPRFKARSA
jgi:hypothetical protein